MIRVKFSALVLAIFFSFLMTGPAGSVDFIEPTKEDKCPVCGMFPYKYPKWVAEIIFKDGSYAVFDGPKDMLKYYFNISKYNKTKSDEDIADIYVTEYYSTKPMKARDLFFVLGSDVHGPMGMEFIPVKGKVAAETFMKDHKGKRIFTFDEITAADIPAMKMKKRMKH